MGYSDDCVCVQGIEQFIDPRPYYPQWDNPLPSRADLPIWDRNMLKKLEEQTAQEEEESSSASIEIEPERCLKLVVQKNILVAQEYVQFIAYQINSFSVQLSSLDKTWLNRDVSLIFQHQASGRQATVPILELGTPVIVPSNVLIPGELKIAAIASARDGKSQSIITTEALKFRVYDSGIKPINWGNVKDYDVYQQYQALAKNLLNEVKDIRANTANEFIGTVTGMLMCTSTKVEDAEVSVPYHVLVTDKSIIFHPQQFSIDGLVAEYGYKLIFSLPLKDLGLLDDIEEMPELDAFKYAKHKDPSNRSSKKIEEATIDIEFPRFTINIPKTLPIDSVDLYIPELIIKRKVEE